MIVRMHKVLWLAVCVSMMWTFAIQAEDKPEPPANCKTAEAKNPFVGKPFFDLQKAFFDSPGPTLNWLPTITVAKDGSVLVFKDLRKKGVIEVFRSEDGGKTWGPAVCVGNLIKIEGDTLDDGRYKNIHLGGKSILGNVIVDETTGDVMVFTTSMKPAEILYRSSDNGKSWKREKIVIKPDKNGWLSCTMASSEPGITLQYGKKKGRLLMPTRVFVGYLNKGENRKYYTQHYSNALYSDDHGKTWYPSEPFPEAGTGESGLVELSDGRIYYNSRTHTRPGNRRIAWSHDGGETWKEHYESKFLPDGPPDVYGCKAGLIRLPLDKQDILIYTSPKDHTAERRDDIMVRASFDGARTWPVNRLIEGGPGDYTWLAAGRKSTPSEGIIYMLTRSNCLVRFNLAWIMERYSKTEEPVKPTNKHLLFDNRLVENTQNVRLTVGTVKKHPANPLFGEEHPWEVKYSNLYPCAIYDFEDKIYKCWYNPFLVDKSAKGMTWQQRESTKYAHPGPTREMCVCYATSKDGIHWEKPELGLIEYGGNRKNNIVTL